MRPLWGSKGHLGSFWQFLAIFVKSKKRASAPSRERIYVVSELLYQYLKTQPDGTRYKKVIQDFNSTVIMLPITYVIYNLTYDPWRWNFHFDPRVRDHQFIQNLIILFRLFASNSRNSSIRSKFEKSSKFNQFSTF